MQLSIIMPVLNEAGQLLEKLQALQCPRSQCEILLVDGGSSDGSIAIAKPLVDKVINSAPGRARQMNLGATQAQAEVLLFLHADTRLPDNALDLIAKAIADGAQWGHFDVQFDSPKTSFKLIAFMMNWRSKLTAIATGDQALFITKAAFQAVGGFPDIALMEDIAISSRLKQLGRPCCLQAKVVTSARRWQAHGILHTILLMWRLRLAFFFGADPAALAARYHRRQ